MQVTVELQDMFWYSLTGVYIAVAVVVLALIIFLVVKFSGKKKPVKVKTVKPVDISKLKIKYDGLLGKLADSHKKGAESDRSASHELSRIVRKFVYEATGIRVQYYTLEEIREADIPSLYLLISECYVPEFAEENHSDVQAIISRARKVIAEWN